ncbi:hypothetical protein [Geodermatophilus sabuli]|uniref:Uncharacterized protein n=1 Tax=Geodermatophilus sabuli TaxID=1564158 RepID=A0A285EJ07_9ACTN|nr:hypothetical protein [Geodermatophilus sabuli]MBB3082994.1 hypothetical protein [Geodermatophilus sabuli]SNX97991.1 hypothetical protein SAMN06893097_10971 [Geodermatophilus sabuli]
MTAVHAAPAGTDRAAAPARRVSRWQLVAALGLAAAGGLHVAAAVDHLESGELAVGFFLLTALAQVGLAAWLALSALTGRRPSPELTALSVLGTVGLLALYVVAHTTALLDAFAVTDPGTGGHAHDVPGREMLTVDPVTGVDFTQGMPVAVDGPVAMDGEPVAAAGHGPESVGTATVGAELLALTALTALLPATWRGRATNGLLALGGLAWVLWFTGVLG